MVPSAEHSSGLLHYFKIVCGPSVRVNHRCPGLQALNAQAAGAKAILVYDDQINDYFVPASDGTLSGITIPSGAIPRRTGQLLVSSSLVRLWCMYLNGSCMKG